MHLVESEISSAAMHAGRCSTDITYDVGFQSDGKLTALRMRGGMLAGFVKDLAGDDISMLKQGTGMVSVRNGFFLACA